MAASPPGRLAAEGRFFPDTYDYVAGHADLERLRRALRAWTGCSRRSGSPRRLLPRMPEEALVLASLIEKETGAAEDRDRIGGVFIAVSSAACVCRPIRR